MRRRYAESARAVSEGSDECGCGSGSCCDGESDAASFGEALYDAEQRGELPEAAALASLGCGNPLLVAELNEGETVLDLGSGGGIDVILSAKRVGPTGHGVRPRHDRRDARARPPERRRGGDPERDLPQGRHRGDSAPGRLGRRRDLELRDQPLGRQAGRADRDRPRAAAGRPDRDQPTSSPRTGSPPRSAPSAAATSAASPVLSPRASTRQGSSAAGFEQIASSSRTRSRTACTARSSKP